MKSSHFDAAGPVQAVSRPVSATSDRLGAAEREKRDVVPVFPSPS